MPPGWCRQGRAAGQDQGQWSGGMTCVGMSKRMLYAYAILLLSLLRRCWTCYAEDALSTINNMAMAMAAGRRTAGPAGHSIGLLRTIWEHTHGSGERGERRTGERTQNSLIISSLDRTYDARRKDFYIARARARAIASASHDRMSSPCQGASHRGLAGGQSQGVRMRMAPCWPCWRGGLTGSILCSK